MNSKHRLQGMRCRRDSFVPIFSKAINEYRRMFGLLDGPGVVLCGSSSSAERGTSGARIETQTAQYDAPAGPVDSRSTGALRRRTVC